MGHTIKNFSRTIFLILLTFTTQAQEALTLKGIVVEKGGDPLIGCNVVIKGTTIGAVTDICGGFSIPLAQDDFTIVFHDMTYEDLRAFELRLKKMEITTDTIVFQIGNSIKNNEVCKRTIDQSLKKFRIK